MITKRKLIPNSLTQILIVILVSLFFASNAYAIVQNNVVGPNSIQVDKSNASGGFLIENAQQGSTAIEGGLILYDVTNSKFRSIINHNGILKINTDGLGTLKRILNEDDLGSFAATRFDSGLFNGDVFNGGIFRGTFVGTFQDPLINGTALFKNNSTAKFNGSILIPANAGNNKVLTSNASGNATWQSLSSIGVDATTLDTYDSSQFLRSDTSDKFTSGTLTMNGGTSFITKGIVRFNGSVFDINSDDIQIADTDILLDGAFTTFNGMLGAINFIPAVDANLNLNLRGNGDLSVRNATFFVEGSNGNVGIGTSAPKAKLDIGGSVVNFIDGVNDLIVKDDVEIDGDLFANKVNGTTANFTSINATGAIVGNTLAGSGSSITNLNASNISSGIYQAPVINGTALFRTNSTAKFNGSILIPANAGVNKVLVSDASGHATWQTIATGGGSNGTVNNVTINNIVANGGNISNTTIDDSTIDNSTITNTFIEGTNTINGKVIFGPNGFLQSTTLNGTTVVDGVLSFSPGSTISGTIYSNGTINARLFNGDVFNGGVFRGSFIGDGSQLTGIASANGTVNNVTINNIVTNGGTINETTINESIINNSTFEGPTINGTVTYMDGTRIIVNGTVFEGPHIEFNGSVFGDVINARLFNGDVFNGGVFRGSFIGDGSQLTGIASANGTVNNVTINNIVANGGDITNTTIEESSIYDSTITNSFINGATTIVDGKLTFTHNGILQSPTINGTALFKNNSIAKFNGSILIPANAGVNKVLVSDASGHATWQTIATGGGSNGTVNNVTINNIVANGGNISNTTIDDSTIDNSTITNTFIEGTNTINGKVIFGPNGFLQSSTLNGTTVVDGVLSFSPGSTISGTIYSNGTINARLFNGDVFNGGIFRGSFIGDGSQLTGIASANGTVNNVTINNIVANGGNITNTTIEESNIYDSTITNSFINGATTTVDGKLTFTHNGILQDPTINGMAFFKNNSTAKFNGTILIPANAGANKVLVSDASGHATWQTIATGGGSNGTVNNVTINNVNVNGGTVNGTDINNSYFNGGNVYNSTITNSFINGATTTVDGKLTFTHNGILQDPTINGMAFFKNNSTAKFNGTILIPANAGANKVLTSDASGHGTWVAASSLSTSNASLLDNIDSAQFLRSDTSDSYTSGTLHFDTVTTLDINGNLTIADTDIVLDGASTKISQANGGIEVRPASGYTFTVNGALALNPSAIASISAGTAIQATNASIIKIAGNGGPVTMSANPQITAGIHGQMLILRGTSNTNTVTVNDGTGLALTDSIFFTMGDRDTLTLIYDAVDGLWIEVSRSDK